MNRQPDCEKYRLWKKERERKLGLRKPRKRERRKEVTDCLEETEQEEDQEQPEKDRTKQEQPECEEKSGKRQRPRLDRLGRSPDPVEILLGKIQPRIEIREQFFNERHLACLDVEQKPGNVDDLDTATWNRTKVPGGRKNISSRGRSKARRQMSERTEENNKEEDGSPPMDAEADAEAVAESGRKSKPSKKKRPKRKRTEDGRRRGSVYSFDSYVCVADIKLTAEEKKKIEGYQSEGSRR